MAGNNNFVSNETARSCRESRCLPLASDDIELDMEAAIDLRPGAIQSPVVLFGSGANGSLSLKVASRNTTMSGQ